MAWNHDDVEPNRSRDELLGEVVRRGEQLRLRRRVVTGLGGTIAVLLVVAGVVAVADPGRQPATQLAAGGRTTTTVAGSAFGPVTGGTVFAVDAPTTSVAAVATTPTTAVTVVTTIPEAPATTIATTTTVPATPDPTVPTPLQPRCGPDQLEATLTFPQATYSPGQQVVGHAVLRNTSGAPCYYYGYTQSQQFHDAYGNVVSPGSALIADAFADTPFGPDATLTADPSWDQSLCAPDSSVCLPAGPATTYSATVSWSFDGPPVEATASFRTAG